MKIAVNAIPLLTVQTGIGRYVRSLYSEIQSSIPRVDIRFFDGKTFSASLPAPSGGRGSGLSAVELLWKLPDAAVVPLRRMRHALRESRFRKEISQFDVYHETSFFPFDTAGSAPTVFIVHDLSLFRHPEFHPPERVRFVRHYFEKRLAGVDQVITPSEFTRQELRELMGFDMQRVTVIAEAHDPKIFHPAEAQRIAAVRQKHGLPDRYFLFVGALEPRKNLNLILNALQRTRRPYPLVCAGWSGWGKALKGGGEHVRCLGYVDDNDLAPLYSGAAAFVYPSFYEGFGLPVLEAMACGCPVICSRAASLPGVGGEAVRYIDPCDESGLAELMNELYNDSELCEDLKIRGLAQAGRFSWRHAAEQTVAVFKNV